jgi:hypothetical protein
MMELIPLGLLVGFTISFGIALYPGNIWPVVLGFIGLFVADAVLMTRPLDPTETFWSGPRFWCLIATLVIGVGLGFRMLVEVRLPDLVGGF